MIGDRRATARGASELLCPLTGLHHTINEDATMFSVLPLLAEASDSRGSDGGSCHEGGEGLNRIASAVITADCLAFLPCAKSATFRRISTVPSPMSRIER